MKFRLILAFSFGVAITALPARAAADEPAAKQTVSPDEKICETIVLTGSRLGKKRICATRAEWEERRRADREWAEGAQKGRCVASTTGGTGRPSC